MVMALMVSVASCMLNASMLAPAIRDINADVLGYIIPSIAENDDVGFGASGAGPDSSPRREVQMK